MAFNNWEKWKVPIIGSVATLGASIATYFYLQKNKVLFFLNFHELILTLSSFSSQAYQNLL